MSQSATRPLLYPQQLALAVAFASAVFSLIDAATAAASDSRPAIVRADAGILNVFKVGCWTPIRVAVEHIDGLAMPRVEVTVKDSDGVPTTAASAISKSAASKGQSTSIVYTKVGRTGSSIEVSLFDGDTRLDQLTIRPDARLKPNSAAVAVPATSELVVSLGLSSYGLKEALPDREADAAQPARQLVELQQVTEMPTEWFGYESVNALLISAADVELCHTLAADVKRFDALTRWVELGGRLVVLSGASTAEKVFAKDGPLGRFAPGKFEEVVRLPETGPLEHFAGAATPLSISQGNMLRIPRFVDVEGKVGAYGGRKVGELPIVVRSPHALGEVTYVGLDFSKPPLADWPGRSSFLQALLKPYLASSNTSDGSQRLVTRGYNDLSGALRQQLGRSFASVATIGFGAVAVLAILYMLFLGPVDYLLVNRWQRRPWIAWISFPLILLVFCGAAMSLSAWRSGSAGVRANQLQLIDVDTMSGRTRGILWAAIYSPVAKQFELTTTVAQVRDQPTDENGVLFSWWGLPGVGIGGMQAGGIDLGIVRAGYRYSNDRKSLLGVPILASATKSLIAGWTATDPPKFEASLSDESGLAVGNVTNQTGLALENVRLFYGTWAYRLGRMNVGQRIEVGEQLSPRKVKTIVTHDAFDDGVTTQGTAEKRLFVPEQASAKEILNLMMFYEAAGGFGFAHLPNRYQAFCDLSSLLELGRAIVVAEAAQPVARLIDDATGNSVGDKQDDSTVIYRFILPVKGRTAH